jgi:TonB family protein
MGDIEVTTWEASIPQSAAPMPAERWRPRSRARRAFIAGTVVVLHVAGALALMGETLSVSFTATTYSYTPVAAYLLDEVAPEVTISAAPTSINWELAPLPVEIELPQLAKIDIEDAAPTETVLQFGQFIPPRPEDANAGNLSEFERAASLRPGEMVRVILRIEVLPDGSTGTVAIDTASGNLHADDAAVRYARSLRWVPASYGGEPTRIKIRLPVVFTGAG